MKMSIAESKSKFRPVNVKGFRALQSVITRHTYSLGTFKNNHRTAANFEWANAIGLDFDGGLSIDDAVKIFKDYRHIIAPTKSHQIPKGGLTQDRFRVILFLDKPITDGKVFTATAKELLKKYPEADKQCSDPSRMFYQSRFIYSSNPLGLTITAATVGAKVNRLSSKTEIDFDRKPAGWSNCIWSISQGKFEKGEGNSAMMSLATNLKKLNYDKNQTYHICLNAYQKRSDDYDKDGLWREVIVPVFADTWSGARYNCATEATWLNDYCTDLGVHACRHKAKAFNFGTVSELYKSDVKLEYLVDGMLTTGGFSIIAGAPKSGKSTIIRQLAMTVSRGGVFLKRKVEKGPVLYLALEEQPSLLKEQFKSLGVTEDDDIKLHVGGVLSSTAFEELQEFVMEHKPKLLVIDTILLLAGVKDANNYNEMQDVLAKYRDLARKSGTHIICVHHQNKGQAGVSTQNRGGGSILGSSAIHGAVDCAIIFNREGQKRYITTTQRGGRPFICEELKYENETGIYTLA